MAMETLTMSTKERRRLALFGQVKPGSLTLRAASQSLGLGYRQTRRMFARFKAQGDAGLVHKLRGRSGNRRRDAAQRDQVLTLYREHYADFGCTLACEYLLSQHGLTVDDQTLRRWLTTEGLWQRRRKSQVKRQRRPRRSCFGDLVQIDGSHHDWFESRPCAQQDGATLPASSCALMVMIDPRRDATGWTHAQFFEGETTHAVMTIFQDWSLDHGLPAQLYPDQDSIYRVNTKAADEIEERTGARPMTQFGRALKELGVKLTCAKSPQAKGRVERMNGTLQDRLVKALRLAGISEMAAANVFLKETFLPQLNEKFSVRPADEADAHRAVSASELIAALCVREERKVGKDQCVSFEGQVLQLNPGRELPSLADKKVTLSRSLEGELTVLWKGKVVESSAVTQRPKAQAKCESLSERVASHAERWRPPSHHPWKRGVVPSQSTPPQSGRPPAEPGSAAASAAPQPALRQAQPAGCERTFLLR